jgi:hypothetical protein
VDVYGNDRRKLMLTLPPDRVEILQDDTGTQDYNCHRTDCGIHHVYPTTGASDREKALIRHGNSLAIVIDKPVLDLLQITADTKIELTTNGDSIMLTPVRDTG